MKIKRALGLIIPAVLLAGFLGWRLAGAGAATAADSPPPPPEAVPVTTATSRIQDVPEYLAGLGVSESGVGSLIRAVYHLLGLRTYLTTGETETRAWTIHAGDKAPVAAGVIHSDFEKSFISAETTAYDDLIACGSFARCRELGKTRTEGKDYVVQDGDIMEFKTFL